MFFQENCEKLINEILPKSLSYNNAELDKAIISLSLGIIDDYPVSDPRWCESVPTGNLINDFYLFINLVGLMD